MKNQDDKYLNELLRNEAHTEKHIRRLKRGKNKDIEYYKTLIMMTEVLAEVRSRLYMEYQYLYDNSKEE